MENRLFSKKHIWVNRDGETAKIGLTDFLQEKLGTIMFVNLPEIGRTIIAGETFGDIESKKTVMDLEAPISGEVIGVNEILDDEPEMINDEPYGAWLIEVKVTSMADDLMDEEAYNKRISQPWMQNH